LTFDPKTPGPNAGQMSAYTATLRGPLPLTPYERRRARYLRVYRGWDWPDIAREIGRTEEDIKHSLATLRTLRRDPARWTANLTIAARDRIRMLQYPGETIWQTVNRLVGV
jgi:hypothetical protein